MGLQLLSESVSLLVSQNFRGYLLESHSVSEEYAEVIMLQGEYRPVGSKASCQ